MEQAASPSRSEVREQLLALLAGHVSREDAATWASEWVDASEPTVDDRAVWEALIQLAGADLRVSPSDYLHGESDFHVWLDELEDAIAHDGAQ